MRVVDKSVEDGVGHGGVRDRFVPDPDRELAGKECGTVAVAVIQEKGVSPYIVTFCWRCPVSGG